MTTSEQICKELEAFYKSYSDVSISEDVAAISEFWGCPCAFISGQQGLVQFTNESDIQRMLRNLSDRPQRTRMGSLGNRSAEDLALGRKSGDVARGRHPL